MPLAEEMIDSWLDPESDQGDAKSVADVEQLNETRLQRLSAGLLREALVAQRVLLARKHGVSLGNSVSGSGDLHFWGHTFASAVAVLMRAPESQDSSERRKRRKRQEQLLKGQETWPDLNAIRSRAYLLCADSLPPEIGLPHQLYPGRTGIDKRLLEFQGFEPLLQALMATVSPSIGPAWLRGKPGLKEALTTLVLETFKNTHDHARRELDQSNVSDSVRGLYACYYSIEEIAALAKESDPDKHSPALRYARNFLPKIVPPGVRGPVAPQVGGLLELSVLDSGPGMAARCLGAAVDHVSVDDQLRAVITCFEKGRTTTGTTGRGYGLAKVLHSLKILHAFMSVRTNHVHVYRQFASQRDAASVEQADGGVMPDAVLYDWRRAASWTPSARAPINGTLVSFLVPMEGAGSQ